MKNIESRIHSSDIDLILFVGEKDENEKKYRAKYGTQNKELPNFLEEFNRIDRFFEQSNFETEFNTKVEGLIVRVPELAIQIKEICNRLTNGQEITDENRSSIFRTTTLLGSDALFQGKRDIEAKWRNEILKIILENSGGEILWNEGIRKYFNLYLAGYEYNPFRKTRDKELQKKRVGIAFEKILSEKNVKEIYKERVKDALSRQRAKIQLPDFQVIQGLKEKLK
ncbi:hypothetical protein KKH59_04760 [Patescibacteria group bacterium]|nr:hypothetical protein [Patescibacteria group bacterium]